MLKYCQSNRKLLKMKKIIYLYLLIFSVSSFSQNIENNINCVTYKVGTNSKIIPKESPNYNPEAEERYRAKIAAMELIECKLFYTKDKSIYYIVDKMDADNSLAYKLATIPFKGLFYKDIISKEKINQTTFGGVNNIILPYDEYKWAITSESKVISGYKSFKATCEYKVLNRKNEYDIRHAEAWFAPEIAVPFGPRGFDGLPGLVLEVFFDGVRYFQAVKIEFDIKDSKVKIERPQKGKYGTLEEYEDMQKKMMEKLPQK